MRSNRSPLFSTFQAYRGKYRSPVDLGVGIAAVLIFPGSVFLVVTVITISAWSLGASLLFPLWAIFPLVALLSILWFFLSEACGRLSARIFLGTSKTSRVLRYFLPELASFLLLAYVYAQVIAQTSLSFLLAAITYAVLYMAAAIINLLVPRRYKKNS